MLNRSLSVVLLATCAWSCVPGRPRAPRPAATLTAAQQSAIGTVIDGELRREFGMLADPALQSAVQQIALRIGAVAPAVGRPWRAAVLDAGAANAFASPGGFVYLTRGLLPYLSSDAEVAAVIAHAMAHVVQGDAAAAYASAGDADPFVNGLFHPLARAFTRGGPRLRPASIATVFPEPDDQLEADANAAALQWLVQAGYDPVALPGALDVLERLDLDSDARGVPTWPMTHGRDSERRRDLRTEAVRTAASIKTRPAVEPTVLPDRVAHLLFGDDPREALQRGNEVIKADLQFAIQIPLDWDVSADRTRLLAVGPDGSALLVQAVAAARIRSPQEIAVTLAQGAGLQAPAGVTTTIDGGPAFLGVAGGRIEGMGDVRASFGCLRSGRRVFLLAGVAEADAFPLVEAQLSSAIRSFRALPADQAALVRPQRVEFDTVRAGDSWDSIARRHDGLVMAALLALLNHSVDVPPVAGRSVKVVVPGEP